MNNIGTYSVIKDNIIIKTGLCLTFYVHGMMENIFEKDQADYVEIDFNNKKLKLYSPKILYKMKPDSVSIDNHVKWFSGCRYELK